MSKEHNNQLNMYQMVAEYLQVDEAEVIDNNDGATVTVFDTIYLVVELENGITEYNYAIIRIV